MPTELYRRSRAPAEELSRQYEELMERAEKARKQGLGRLEQNFLSRAEKVYREMREAQERAARTIFYENNSWRPYNEIDLHGMHSHEAETKLIHFLRSRRSYDGTISIITGRGNNSRDPGVSVIKSRVLQFLETNRYTFSIPEYNTGRVEVKMDGPRWR